MEETAQNEDKEVVIPVRYMDFTGGRIFFFNGVHEITEHAYTLVILDDLPYFVFNERFGIPATLLLFEENSEKDILLACATDEDSMKLESFGRFFVSKDLLVRIDAFVGVYKSMQVQFKMKPHKQKQKNEPIVEEESELDRIRRVMAESRK